MRSLFLTLSFVVTSQAQVSQVAFKVLPNKQLEITYRLTEAGNITARAILDHKIIPIKTATGAIGKNTSPGLKSLRWDVLKDVESLTGELEIEVSYRPSNIQTTYKTVQIGDQIWMAENLNIEIDGSSCYDNNPANCAKYGRLYTWFAAMKIAEQIEGWHLPTDEEWNKLCEAVGGIRAWYSRYDYEHVGTKLRQGGSSGFEALLAGYRYINGSFYSLGYYGKFWSASTRGIGHASRRSLYASSTSVYRFKDYRGYHLSVRLVKD